MKTNAILLSRSFSAASLLLTLLIGLSSCDRAEQAQPRPVAVHILPPAVAPDTLTDLPDNPKQKPVPIKPFIDPQSDILLPN